MKMKAVVPAVVILALTAFRCASCGEEAAPLVFRVSWDSGVITSDAPVAVCFSATNRSKKTVYLPWPNLSWFVTVDIQEEDKDGNLRGKPRRLPTDTPPRLFEKVIAISPGETVYNIYWNSPIPWVKRERVYRIWFNIPPMKPRGPCVVLGPEGKVLRKVAAKDVWAGTLSSNSLRCYVSRRLPAVQIHIGKIKDGGLVDWAVWKVLSKTIAKDHEKYGRLGLEVKVGQEINNLELDDKDFARFSSASQYGAAVIYRARRILVPRIMVNPPSPDAKAVARARKLLQDFVLNHQGSAFLPLAKKELARLNGKPSVRRK